MTTTTPGAASVGVPAAPGLYPTKTQLRLLGGVRRGEVVCYLNSGDSHWNGPTGGGVMVTTRIEAMHRAGWVELGPELDGGAVRRWVLTDIAPAVTP